MKLQDILERVASSAIEKQTDDGAFPAGQNGPHDNPETPIRNTSHYLVLLSRLYKETKKEEYKNAAAKATDYLRSEHARPHGYTFDHLKKGPDRCNGTIGSAWTIEGIAEAGRILDIPDLIKTAEEVFLQHPFDEKLGFWKRLEVDGEVLCLDSTYNHQLWFAAAGGLLSHYHDVDSEIDYQVNKFLDRSTIMMGQRESGLFELLSLPPLQLYPYIGHIDNKGRMLLVLLASNFPLLNYQLVRNTLLSYTPISRLPLTSSQYYRRLVGYHSFHLYGFALLKQVYPDHDLWNEDFIPRGMAHAHTEKFIRELQSNQYGYPYNISGVEMAYAVEIFGESNPECQEEWLSRQFELCWDENEAAMNRNNRDPETLTARLYEAARLSNLGLEITT